MADISNVTQSVTTPDNETLLEFPCDFVLKVMGLANQQFDDVVHDVVSRHVGPQSAEAIREKASRGGKYKSLSVTVHVHSQRQLDNLYRELSGHELVLMVL